MKLPFGHQRLRDQLSAYLDGELASRESDHLAAHLLTCEACRQRLEELHLTRDALSTLPAATAPRSFALRADQVARPAPAPSRRALPLAWGAATALAAFALVFATVGSSAIDGGSDNAPKATLEQAASGLSTDAAQRSSADSQLRAPTTAANALPSNPPAETSAPAALPDNDGHDGWRAAQIAAGATLAALLLAGGGYVALRRGAHP